MEATIEYRGGGGGLELLTAAVINIAFGKAPGFAREEVNGAVFRLAIPRVGEVTLNPDHPFERHAADEVNRVRRCLEQNGPAMVYREIRPGLVRFHLLCKEPGTGSWMDMIIQKIGDAYHEITSFPVKGGATDWNLVLAWLARKKATRFTRPLP